MNIRRPQLESEFRRFAEAAHGVVIGSPGSGKSHLLRGFVEECLATGVPCLFLPLDRLPIKTDDDLRRHLDIRCDDLVRGLDEHIADAPRAFLVIDALDAARSDEGRDWALSVARRVIGHSGDVWRVVLSARTYDALRSAELLTIFPAQSGEPPSREFRASAIACRHFAVPLLSDTDITTAVDGLPWLEVLYGTAHPDLKSLLRVPFNLWLLEQVLSSQEVGVDDVGLLRSEVQLLSLYWRQRVETGERAAQKQALLQAIARDMVDARALSLPLDQAFRDSAILAWNELASSEVIVAPPQAPSRVEFGHNILFDYAVSILLVDDSVRGFKDFLADDPSRALFMRPSLNYFFARLWFEERSRFWDVLWSVQASDEVHIRLFTQVIPPTVVASELRDTSDLEPIVAGLSVGDLGAQQALVTILQARKVLEPSATRDKVWSQATPLLSKRPARVFAWELARLLHELAETDIPDLDTAALGAASRDMLSWGLTQVEDAFVGRISSVFLVPSVASTFTTDRDASSDLLRQILDRVGDPEMPVDFFYRLADSMPAIAKADPTFAVDVYDAIFAHVETSEEVTSMGGAILSLSSTRRQDFEMAQYVLKRHLRGFINSSPIPGIVAAVRAINAVVVGRRASTYADHRAEAVVSWTFRGRSTRWLSDGSHYWDAPGAHPSDEAELMGAVRDYLEKGLSANLDVDASAAIDAIADEAVVAFIWRSLLTIGSENPEKLVGELSDLLRVPLIMTSPETTREAAAFLGAAASRMTPETLREIENAVVALGQSPDDSDRHAAARLIWQIPEELLATPEGRDLHRSTVDDSSARANRPLVEFGPVEGRAYTHRDWLDEQGIDTSSPQAQDILSLTDKLREFESSHRNARAERADREAILPLLGEALESVALLDEGDPLAEDTWTAIGEVAETLVRSVDELEPAALEICREALLACSKHPAPLARDPEDEFTSPGWSPAPRNEAAQGLPWVAHAAPDSEVLAALMDLSRDPVPSVRFLLAIEIFRIVDSAPAELWKIAAEMLAHETNATVLDGLVNSLARITPNHEEEVVGLLRQPNIESKLVDSTPRFRGEDSFSTLVAGLAVGRGNEWARGVLDEAIEATRSGRAEIGRYLWHILPFIDANRTDINELLPSVERATEYTDRAIRATSVAIDVLRTKAEDGSELDHELARAHVRVLDDVASRLYFQSGVYQSHEHPALPQVLTCVFFGRVEGVLQTIVESVEPPDGVGLPASTAHYLVQLLRGCAACHPVVVVDLTRRIVQSARGAGYTLDGLAAKEVTQLVELLLADHRDEMTQGASLENLMILLDMFVETGWPEAQRLVWRLEELYR